ncbi:iron-containing alcohol dehydrogenase [Alteribacillus bidgolensis]|uniref:Alcohol dehydrogenase, class IV n=1 Tax=Alteribacillus bidgolensis TaxID=930129 RepID=A0A1G8NHM2_9BACI|nr:iron-containing alcohol dehydrogenase [Alteribacillus bidgolensis]SDI79693.1 Alcohol dehydrogenase, class IV [Alteribacillus bidgolensis]
MTNFYQFRSADRIFTGVRALKTIKDNIHQLPGDIKNVLIIAQPSMLKFGYVDTLQEALSSAGVTSTVRSDVTPEPTIHYVEEAVEEINQDQYDAMIGIGGGSVLDVTKFFAVCHTNEQSVRDMMGIEQIQKPGVPMVLIPSTSGTGSEVTPNSILTLPAEELKVGVVSQYFLPQQVYLDASLTLELPKSITAATGMDAFTHSLESYISNKANPLSDMFAMESMKLISDNILEAYHNGKNETARENMLLGSMLGGMALSAAGTAAVHAMAYLIGGSFGVTHGVANSMLLPHVMEFNYDSVEERLETIAQETSLSKSGNASDVLESIRSLTAELEIPQDLSAYGVKEEDVPDLAVAASNVKRLMDNNPKQMSVEEIEMIYRRLLL